MTYLNRPLLLNYIKRHCLTTIGFDEAFAHADRTVLDNIFYMIEEHRPILTPYEEYIDFLDGNGFSVKKFMDNLYILQYLYKEEPQ